MAEQLHTMPGMEGNMSSDGIKADAGCKSRAWIWFLAVSIGLPMLACAAVVVAAVLWFAANHVPSHRAAMGVDEFPALRETWSYGHGVTKVVRIPVKGVLVERDEGGLFASRGPVETALRQIRAATEDGDVKAIILEVDSPGGGVTASDLMYKALLDFKASTPDRKIVALLGDIAASGGYYVTTAADYIIAQPTTITGSIGVIISKYNIKKLGDDYGVKLETIKSGRNKDILSPFADLSDEQKTVLQDVVDEMYQRFVGLVARARPGVSKDDLQRLTDGRVFTSTKALECKLIDEIGYWNDAVAKTEGLLDVKEVKVVRYSEEFSLSDFLSGLQDVSLSANGLFNRMARVRLLTLWQL
jgi:protease IV